MPMPLAPRSPRPRMRPPSVTQMNRTSLTGQLRSTSLNVPLAGDRQIHPVRTAKDVVELQAGFGDCRVVHYLEESRRVRHQGVIEERLVRIEQIHQVDEPVEIGGLVFELEHDTRQ